MFDGINKLTLTQKIENIYRGHLIEVVLIYLYLMHLLYYRHTITSTFIFTHILTLTTLSAMLGNNQSGSA